MTMFTHTITHPLHDQNIKKNKNKHVIDYLFIIELNWASRII